MRLVVCDSSGCFGIYGFDQDDGGDCSLIKQFFLVEADHDIQEQTNQGNCSDVVDSPSPTPGEHSLTSSSKLFLQCLGFSNFFNGLITFPGDLVSNFKAGKSWSF